MEPLLNSLNMSHDTADSITDMDPKFPCKWLSLRRVKLKKILCFLLCVCIANFSVTMPALEKLYEYGIATKRYQHEGVSEIRERDKTLYSSFSSTIIEDVREISQVVSAPDTSEIESEDGKKFPKPAKVPEKETYVSSLTEEDGGRIENVDQLPSESMSSFTSTTNGTVNEEKDLV